jgi:carboxymethylenebutenolidase
MSDDIRARAIALYDRFTHEGLDRRAFMAELTRIAGSAAAANALLLGIAASPAAAAVTNADDPRLLITRGSLGLEGHALDGYMAAPKGKKRLPSVIVIHENRGLNAHIEDVARRLALAGYFTVAPDFLTPAGGTPADQDKAREMIGKLDLGASMTSAVALARKLKGMKTSNGKVGAVGFCWGGGAVNNLAVNDPQLNAAVPYYGAIPAADQVVKIKAPLLLNYADKKLDQRLGDALPGYEAALKANNKPYQLYVYEGANHAFNDDTNQERYNKAAADLAWGRTVAFFKQHLA